MVYPNLYKEDLKLKIILKNCLNLVSITNTMNLKFFDDLLLPELKSVKIFIQIQDQNFSKLSLKITKTH
jgi:hypothetical protein